MPKTANNFINIEYLPFYCASSSYVTFWSGTFRVLIPFPRKIFVPKHPNVLFYFRCTRHQTAVEGWVQNRRNFRDICLNLLPFFLEWVRVGNVCVSVELIHQETSGIQSLIPLFLCLRAGYELLYRNREGDVVKFNVDTDEKTILVHNKKFVSCFFHLLLPPYSLTITGPKIWPRLPVNSIKTFFSQSQQIKATIAPFFVLTTKLNQMIHYYSEMRAAWLKTWGFGLCVGMKM